MPTYSYRAKNLKGEELKGTYDTTMQESLEFMLNEKGYFLVDLKEEGKKFSLSDITGKVSVKEISVFCRQFSVILKSGLTVVEAILILSDQAEKKNFREILKSIHEELQKGKLLSNTLDMYPRVFPDFLRNMVQIGEASGSLDTVMNRLAEYYERENKVRRKVRSAMTYPMILAILIVGVVILLMWKVLPMFSDMLQQNGGDMPGITKIMMGISHFVVNNITAIFIGLILGVSGIVYYFRTEPGRYLFDGMKLKLPLIKKVTVKVITSRFARSMGILLKSGIPILRVIEIMEKLIGNRVVEEKFKACSEEIREGHGIAVPIRKIGIFPSLLIHMISVGENTGELDEMLTRTAGFFDEEVE
ncbi:MAG: type II secretion system F family protein, partial [Bacillota bacterium]|nr:type II secretion system F family protein [Bacillota bacterium]